MPPIGLSHPRTLTEAGRASSRDLRPQEKKTMRPLFAGLPLTAEASSTVRMSPSARRTRRDCGEPEPVHAMVIAKMTKEPAQRRRREK
jgi:hypothetical protein